MIEKVRPGTALFFLRLFLGGTFVYAGIQKLSDPGYLHPGAPTYIGTQLEGFANGTPGGFILTTFALPHPIVAGVGVAIVEIAIGLLAMTGLLTRLAAAAGLGLNLLLFLTASWHTTPYFLGPDIVFVFAWLPFVLTGASDQPALDNALRDPSPELVRRTTLGSDAAAASVQDPSVLTRRALVAEIGAMALGIAGIAALAKGTYQAPPTVAATGGSSGGGGGGGGSASGSGGGGTGASGASSGSGSSASGGGASGGGSASASSSGASAGGSGVPSNAVKLASSSRLPDNQGATYSDPGDGQPDIIIRQPDGSLTAFSAVCTHAGCTVGYQNGIIACPCHGATYDPKTGAVTGGPAPQGLAPRKVIEQGGEIYAIPS